MADLSGKVAIVTGAAGKRGMGRAISLRFARDGAHVAVVDLPEASLDTPPGWKGIASVAEEISEIGCRALAIGANIAFSADIAEAVRRVREELGRIDILVNCAAVRMNPNNTPVVDIEEADWERVLRINLTSQFLLSKAVARVMIEQGEGGKIVNVASVTAKSPTRGMAAYCAAKAGMLSLTGVMALELAPHKIYVNAICPGGIFTDHTVAYRERLMKEKGFTSQAQADEWRRQNIGSGPALGRQGTADEIANAAAFLVSDEASYIDGQAINVCGAWVLER